jgi:hypothetical protein
LGFGLSDIGLWTDWGWGAAIGGLLGGCRGWGLLGAGGDGGWGMGGDRDREYVAA